MQRRVRNDCPVPESRLVPLRLDTIVDLVERQGYYDETKDCVDVILRRSSSSHKRRCLEEVNNYSESKLE